MEQIDFPSFCMNVAQIKHIQLNLIQLLYNPYYDNMKVSDWVLSK